MTEKTTTESQRLRIMLAFSVTQAFFDGSALVKKAVAEALEESYADLRGRFGVTVLATIDDDQLAVGPSYGWPWTSYVIADAPDLDCVFQLCDLIRRTPVGEVTLSRYIRIEARVGRPLFFANN